MRKMITLCAFMASFGLSSVWALLIKLNFYSVALSLFVLLSANNLHAQLTDGFESGNISNWTTTGGTYTTRGVTTSSPRSGTYALQLTGGGQIVEGLRHSFTSSQVTRVEWSFKVSNIYAKSAYVTLRAPGNNSEYIFYAYVRFGKLWFIGSPNFSAPISGNTWYDVVVDDIDWTNKTMDIYLDGVLIRSDYSFRHPSLTSAGVIDLFNFVTNTSTIIGTAYYDDISISSTPSCSLAASITAQTNIECNGASTGQMTVTATSGSANYDYAWSNGTNNSGQSSASNSISGLAAGTYTVTVTDANGCTATTSETLSEAALLTGGSVSF